MVRKMYILNRNYIKRDLLDDHISRIIKNQYNDINLPRNFTDSILKLGQIPQGSDQPEQDDLDSKIILQVGCVGITCLIMIFVLFFRYRQIRLLPNLTPSEPSSQKIRFVLIIFLILTNIAPLPFVLTENGYHYEPRSLKYISLVHLFIALTLTLQIFILYYELKKKVTIFWAHKVFWLGLTGYHICIIAQDIQDYSVNILIFHIFLFVSKKKNYLYLRLKTNMKSLWLSSIL